MENIEDWVEKAVRNKRVDFIRDNPHPVLLYKGTDVGAGFDARRRLTPKACLMANAPMVWA